MYDLPQRSGPCSFQDLASTRTFIDPETSHSVRASIREAKFRPPIRVSIHMCNFAIRKNVLVFAGILLVANTFAGVLSAQKKSMVERALSYKPKQRNIEYDVPEKNEVSSCKIESTTKKFNKMGFLVSDSTGRTLRLFFDIDRDEDLDWWSYYKDGIEVYRELDTNFDGRVDEFRWMGTAGTRHGKDIDKNGTIDRWLRISASEVAEEVFHSVRTGDTARFKRLLVNSEELTSMNLGDSLNSTVAKKIREASGKFASFAKSQKAITGRTKWLQFGGTRPALVPGGAEGLGKDLTIYDHAAAVFENGENFGQISLGTIVEVSPNNWRVLELPQIVSDSQVVQNGGLLYSNSIQGSGPTQIVDSNGNPETQNLVKLFEKYDALEKQIKSAKGGAAIAKLEEDRANLFMQLAQESTKEQEKRNWIRQMADTVASGYQTNRFPRGLKFLKAQVPKIKSMGLSDEVAYLSWREIYAEYLVGHNGDRRARNKANEKYIADLEGFVKTYSKSEFAAEAYFQLGLNAEVSERDGGDKAVQWYTKCRRAFPESLFGRKAAGAVVRLTSTEKALPFRGTTINGKRFDLQSNQFRGKVVVIHFWEVGCQSCIEGFEELQRIGAKYKSDVQIIGANLDSDLNTVKKYLGKNRSVSWPQLYEKGGAEKSPLALQLGVTTLPLTVLIDQRGRLVENNLPVDDLDREIQRLIRRASGTANLRKSTR